MPVLLDTDHLSILQWRELPACDRLLERLDQVPPDDIATSIISFQEQAQGWLAYLKRSRKPEQIAEAQTCFSDPKHRCPRLQTLDLRIAAIAITTQSVLLSRNLRDFRRVPDLEVDDWTT